MEGNGATELPIRFKVLLATLGFAGVTLILVATSRYGIGVSPDSIQYISTARNLATGNGFLMYNGRPFVRWPPFYPIVLALIYKVLGLDPLHSARVVNAVVFGLIVYLSGLLIARYLARLPACALLGALLTLFSRPLFNVSVMAWTELLFILFVLLFFINLESYLRKSDITSLGLLSASLALACLTRYIGVTLIASGTAAILLLCKTSVRSRLIHLFLLGVVSILPIGVWAIRNYTITGTFFGPRAPSRFTLSQNLYFTFRILLLWVLPRRIAKHYPILIVLIVIVVGYLAVAGLKNNWSKLKRAIHRIAPIAIFTATYTIFLVISSTAVAFDIIDDRLLSPVYVPVIILTLFLAGELVVQSFRERFSGRIVNGFIIAISVIWLLYPLGTVALGTKQYVERGAGSYNTNLWKESETLQYLQHQSLQGEYTIYSNAPEVLYIWANISAKRSLVKVRDDLSTFRGLWPEAGAAYLVWFDNMHPTYLFTVEELQSISDISLVAKLADGTIYTVSPKER